MNEMKNYLSIGAITVFDTVAEMPPAVKFIKKESFLFDICLNKL